MTKLKLIGLALAMAAPTSAFAASCCVGLPCCQNGADCCDQANAKGAGHGDGAMRDMPGMKR